MFKTIILSQIGADRYEKLIFEILLLPPSLGELCTAANHVSTIVELNVIGGVASINWSGVKGVAPEPPPGSGAAKGTAFSMIPSSLVLFNFGCHFDG